MKDSSDIFPQIRVFTPVRTICECVGNAVLRVAEALPTMLNPASELCLSPRSGAARRLDDGLDQPPTLFDEPVVID